MHILTPLLDFLMLLHCFTLPVLFFCLHKHCCVYCWNKLYVICQYTPPCSTCSNSWTQKPGRLWYHTCLVCRISTRSCPRLFKFVFLEHKPVEIRWSQFVKSGLTFSWPRFNVGKMYKYRNLFKKAEEHFLPYHGVQKKAWWNINLLFLVVCLFLSWIMLQDMSTFHRLWHLCNWGLESVKRQC
jgi:hypothetical protein